MIDFLDTIVHDGSVQLAQHAVAHLFSTVNAIVDAQIKGRSFVLVENSLDLSAQVRRADARFHAPKSTTGLPDPNEAGIYCPKLDN
jgi:hypothetical protein